MNILLKWKLFLTQPKINGNEYQSEWIKYHG